MICLSFIRGNRFYEMISMVYPENATLSPPSMIGQWVWLMDLHALLLCEEGDVDFIDNTNIFLKDSKGPRLPDQVFRHLLVSMTNQLQQNDKIRGLIADMEKEHEDETSGNGRMAETSSQ